MRFHRREELEEGGDEKHVFWGLCAGEAIALRCVARYNIACELPLIMSLFLWVLPTAIETDYSNEDVNVVLLLMTGRVKGGRITRGARVSSTWRGI